MDFDIRSDKRLVLDARRLHSADKRGLIDRFAPRKCPREVVAIHPPKIGPIAQLNGARGLFLQVDDFLPLHIRVGRLKSTASVAVRDLVSLRAPSRSKSHPHCQKRRSLVHCEKPPLKDHGATPGRLSKVYPRWIA